MFDWYLKNELEPALAWIDTPDGMEFVKKNFCDLYDYVFVHRDNALCCNYIISYKGTPIYIGESVKPWKRACVHLWHMANQPEEYFGVSKDELIDVTFRLVGPPQSDTVLRKDNELRLRRVYEPVINPPQLGDRCIPKAKRYGEVHKIYNDKDKLCKVINVIVFEAPWIFGWPEMLRKTPCFDPKADELSYGVERRVKEYIESLTKDERVDLLRKVAINLGGGFYVHKSTAIKVLARIIDGFETMEEFHEMNEYACRYQINQRVEFVKARG